MLSAALRPPLLLPRPCILYIGKEPEGVHGPVKSGQKLEGVDTAPNLLLGTVPWECHS